MPEIQEMEVTTEEEAEAIRQFAISNHEWMAEKLAKIMALTVQGDLDRATVGFALAMAEAYTSGVKAGMSK